MPGVSRDTVEEFWDASTLALCSERAQHVETTDFLDELRVFLGVSGKMWATSSGRTALQQFLADTVSAEKTSVLVCSFNCRVVADAVMSAGFRVETFDLAGSTGRVDWEKIIEQLRPQYGALVVPHLFGVPNDFRPVRRAAEKLGVFVVEDCAQTLGGKIGDFMAGTLGDAAIFSFNYDKPISLGGGGALLVNNPDLWSKIGLDRYSGSLDQEKRELDLFMGYLQKRRQSIDQVTLAHRIFKKAKRVVRLSRAGELFPVSGVGPLRAALGLWQLERYPEIMSKRNENAALFSDGTRSQSWHVGPNVSPAWVKQKAIPFRLEEVNKISLRLQRRGLRVGPFNWNRTLDQYLGFPEKPNAGYVAKYGLDIPIHQNMTRDELEFVRRVICGEAER